jgi:hypothetical protein
VVTLVVAATLLRSQSPVEVVEIIEEEAVA